MVPAGTAVGGSVSAGWSATRIIGFTGLPGADGQDGDDGGDGQGYEYIFAVTSGTTPGLPSNAWNYDTRAAAPSSPLASTWYDGAPSVSLALPVLWQCQRVVPGGTTPGRPVSGLWTAPRKVGDATAFENLGTGRCIQIGHIQICWGSIVTASTSSPTSTQRFPKRFTRIPALSLTAHNSSGGTFDAPSIRSVTTGGFIANFTSGEPQIDWVAVGPVST